MPTYLVDVALKLNTRPEEDDVHNSWCVAMADGFDPTTDLLDLTAPIANFYKDLTNFWHNGLTRAAVVHELRVFDLTGHLDGSPHGSPVVVDKFSIPARTLSAGADPMPQEVAIAMTLRADTWASQPVERVDGADAGTAVDRPRARYTGKLFLGNLSDGTRDATGAIARVGSWTRSDMLDAIQSAQGAFASSGNLGLCVWSRSDGVRRPVTHVSIDDAYDTQRRRGIDASTISLRTL